MFLTMQEQEDLVARKLATKKVNGNYVTYKYAKKVMFDYLWEKHPELLECRGHTYNIRTGELILAAPRKSFNYLELDTWKNVPLDTEVIAFRKWNGFMASACIVDGELLVATTGTTNEETSQYVSWAKREISKLNTILEYPHTHKTSIYEIVVPEDPHIVSEEKSGAIHLLDRQHDGFYSLRGEEIVTTLGNLLERAKVDKHEGWMVYDAYQFDMGAIVPSTCKIKTDYYVGKKKLMRMGDAKATKIFGTENSSDEIKQMVPQQWRKLVERLPINVDKDAWLNTTDQERRTIIESLEEKYYG